MNNSSVNTHMNIYIYGYTYIYKGVSKNRGTPKWMVKILETPIKMDDLGVRLFSETPICCMTQAYYVYDGTCVYTKKIVCICVYKDFN